MSGKYCEKSTANTLMRAGKYDRTWTRFAFTHGNLPSKEYDFSMADRLTAFDLNFAVTAAEDTMRQKCSNIATPFPRR